MKFTVQETKTVEMLINGMSNSEISEKMYISVAQLKKALRHVYAKTNCYNRIQLTIYLLQAGAIKES